MTFVQMIRSEIFDELVKTPLAFVLLAIIARRAKRTDKYNRNNLQAGEALIGDYKNYGMSEQNYRTAKSQLTRAKFITVKVTNKGTIAKLINTDVFDINTGKGNEQSNEPLTDELTDSQRTGNEPLTTKKEDKKEKNDNNDKKKTPIPPLDDFLSHAKESCNKANLNFSELSFAIESKYNTWVADGWKDGFGNKILGWKNKFNNTLPNLKPIKQPLNQHPAGKLHAGKKDYSHEKL